MSDELRLNVGCGRDRKNGYVGVDMYDTGAADIIAPAWDLPYKNSTVDEVFTSHMIEHLEPANLRRAFAEWLRVLKSGGLLKIRCPNFPVYVQEFIDYERDDLRWTWGLRNLIGWQDKGKGYWNRNGFDLARLTRTVQAAGFTVKFAKEMETRAKPGSVEYRPNGDLWCEATKPS